MPWTLSFEIPAPTYSSPLSSARVGPAAGARSVVSSILRMAAPPSSITSSITGAGGCCPLLPRGDSGLCGRSCNDSRGSGKFGAAALRLAGRYPYAQGAMPRGVHKVVVGTEQYEPMAHAKLREQRVDGSKLYARTSAAIADCRCIDVVLPVGHQQRQG